ncbi:MAG TPA: hypothetical protein EYP47_03095, partial [Methanococcaceae archaeon]|nr:hypothetical protein [Methanococcaceae archaeon]
FIFNLSFISTFPVKAILFISSIGVDLSKKLPQTREEMLDIHGIGEVKFERYGEK